MVLLTSRLSFHLSPAVCSFVYVSGNGAAGAEHLALLQLIINDDCDESNLTVDRDSNARLAG